MDLLLDWFLGFTIISVVMIISIYYVLSYIPTVYTPSLRLELREKYIAPTISLDILEVTPYAYLVVSNKDPIKANIIIVLNNGSFLKLNVVTPAFVPKLGFTVVFSASAVFYAGSPPKGTFYVSKHGVYTKVPKEIPYVLIFPNGTITVYPHFSLSKYVARGTYIPILFNNTLFEVKTP